jgi:hypothetical protein
VAAIQHERFLDLDTFHGGFARARDRRGWMHVDRSGSARLLVEYGDRTLFSGRCEFRPGLVAAVPGGR